MVSIKLYWVLVRVPRAQTHIAAQRIPGWQIGRSLLMRGDLIWDWGSLASTNELTIEEKFDDAKGVRSHKTKDRQYYDQKKKGQTIIYKTLLRKLKIRQCEPH